jgi:hypothetical protein
MDRVERTPMSAAFDFDFQRHYRHD